MLYDSPKEIKKLLESEQLALTKRFGQIFLINPGVRERIVDLIEPKTKSHIWEIGPGIGSLTCSLLPNSEQLTVFEIDHGFCNYLKQKWKDAPGFKVVPGNFLKTWADEAKQTSPSAICGNLPYNAGARIILDLIKGRGMARKMIFMLQKEAAGRFVACPKTKDYSVLSVLSQAFCSIKLYGDIPPSCFFPRPKVDSTLIELSPKPKAPFNTAEILFPLVKDLFSSRRKTIKNNLQKGTLSRYIPKNNLLEALSELNVSDSARAEQLTVEHFIELSYIVKGIVESLIPVKEN